MAAVGALAGTCYHPSRRRSPRASDETAEKKERAIESERERESKKERREGGYIYIKRKKRKWKCEREERQGSRVATGMNK